MNRSVLLLVPLVLALAACRSKSPDLSGQWQMSMGATQMQVEFGPNGQYTGMMMGAGGMGQVTGAYRVSGTTLEMDPPVVTGPGGTATPSGGKMRVKMIQQGPNMIRLDAGNQTFMLTRMGPPPR